MMFQSVGLLVNHARAEAVQAAGQTLDFFRKQQIEAFELTPSDDERALDLVLTFGGDGTLLSGARLQSGYAGIPDRTGSRSAH